MTLPSPETMLTYASILEKPQYLINPETGIRYKMATGEIIEAACAALRFCAALKSAPVCSGSLPSGESDPSVMLDYAGADTQPALWQLTWPDGAHSYYRTLPKDLCGCTAIALHAAPSTVSQSGGIVGEPRTDELSNISDYGNSPREIQKRAMMAMSPRSAGNPDEGASPISQAHQLVEK